ncbi:MAG: hypothetical protein IPL22_21500 [Bacteroidetes bacterium]|nr:hypothetical protein [Bacteroidota bacterium]
MSTGKLVLEWCVERLEFNYAYGLGKFILAAAGTSFSWTSWWGVIYPAAYSSCVAVTE